MIGAISTWRLSRYLNANLVTAAANSLRRSLFSHFAISTRGGAASWVLMRAAGKVAEVRQIDCRGRGHQLGKVHGRLPDSSFCGRAHGQY